MWPEARQWTEGNKIGLILRVKHPALDRGQVAPGPEARKGTKATKAEDRGRGSNRGG